MSEKLVKETIGKVFNELADFLESGDPGQKAKVVITAPGNDHGEEEVYKGAINALKHGIDISVIGTKTNKGIKTVLVDQGDNGHKRMEELLDGGNAQAGITMLYTFPIGIASVGRIVTPSKGKEIFISTTTGASSTNRVEGMVKNAIYGIITAKACGIKNPRVGILNIDGGRQTEVALKELKNRGYDINFAKSERTEDGALMRGNDLLTGSCDVMVMDSLTGNLIMKIFSSYTTGGSYESLGYGYGPGIGENLDKLILIISRASGASVIEGAIKFAADLIRGKYLDIAKSEMEKAKKAGLDSILTEIKSSKEVKTGDMEVILPAREVVTSQIIGIDVMDLEDAVRLLWKKGIYAESGMGCTGPIILVNDANKQDSLSILTENSYLSKWD